MACIDPTTPEGLAYIADHLGATYDADDLAAFLDDDLIKCEDCGRLFTSFSDFDYDRRVDHGEWFCDECAADPDNAPYDLARNEGTYQ
jgi:hypothetical protein